MHMHQVKAMLWRHHRAVYGAFDYYATLYTEEGTGRCPHMHMHVHV